MAHTCDCHNRTFPTLRGLNAHLSHIKKVLINQSEACSDAALYKANSVPELTPSGFESRASSDKRICIDDNEWTRSDEYANTELECDTELDSDDNDPRSMEYVLHQLDSLQKFTRDLFSKVEQLSKATTNNSNDAFVNNLLDEIAYLRNENKSKTEAIKALSNACGQNLKLAFHLGSKMAPSDKKEKLPTPVEACAPLNADHDESDAIPQVAQLPVQTAFDEQNDRAIAEALEELPPTPSEQDSVESVVSASSSPPQRRPTVVTQSMPEHNKILSWRERDAGQRQPRTVPGNSTYAGMAKDGKKIAIFGDSIIKRVAAGQLNRGIRHGRAFVRPFVGATAKQVQYHMLPELQKGDIDAAVLSVGHNNVASKRKDALSPWEEQNVLSIVDEIIELVRTVKNHGVSNVFVNLLTPQKFYRNKVKDINSILCAKCKPEGFILIDNYKNFNENHLFDNIHLNNEGLQMYTQNIIDAINNTL